jgi:hypothetical protein
MPDVLKRGARKDYEGPVFIVTTRDYARYRKNTYYYTRGKMVNTGGGGLCFESEYAIQPGSDISIKMSGDLTSSFEDHGTDYMLHNGKVKWCRQMDKPDGKCYGIGVEIVEDNVRDK